MNRNLNTPILLLTLSAIVLGALVLTLQTPDEAYATGETVRHGRWILSTGRIDDDTDVLYVLDLKLGRITVYGASERNQRLGKVTSAELKAIFAGARAD